MFGRVCISGRRPVTSQFYRDQKAPPCWLYHTQILCLLTPTSQLSPIQHDPLTSISRESVENVQEMIIRLRKLDSFHLSNVWCLWRPGMNPITVRYQHVINNIQQYWHGQFSYTHHTLSAPFISVTFCETHQNFKVDNPENPVTKSLIKEPKNASNSHKNAWLDQREVKYFKRKL